MNDPDICPVCGKPLPPNYPMMVHPSCMPKVHARQAKEAVTATRRTTSDGRAGLFDPNHGFQFTMPGEEKAPNVTALVHPEDIEIVLPAFGPRMYREGLCEVILKPGSYIVAKQTYKEQGVPCG
jgi:hypothetical protein